ncbi:hypothetical protein COV93_02030 [Candidatus Woesearchaeota archaeon CG11_big_fil_rev_8_21_14_0_20_43_8]|nr:MAG: hypothetical protein COV93_02030 [Candidatus Woesearchaeota archaeon CG11_big_fil_rev_8_21_14_0_20_43_8]PIO07055.1 MAG: hypothetical protein COT47_01720 [Candidatus Woesearchaeota archaeon CG08_land_8_20_14_0_20_43_7]
MSIKKKEEVVSVEEGVLEDISLASRLLNDSNRKLVTKIREYEDEISLLRKEIDVLKQKAREDNIDTLKDENDKLYQALKELDEKHKNDLDELSRYKGSLIQEKERALILKKELSLLIGKLKDKEDTLKKKDVAFKAKQDESLLATDISRRLMKKGERDASDIYQIKEIIDDKNYRLKRLMKIIERLSKELHDARVSRREDVLKMRDLHGLLVDEKNKSTLLRAEIAKINEKSIERQQEIARLIERDKNISKLLEDTRIERDKAFVDLGLASEEVGEKKRLIVRLDQALNVKKNETQIILQMNKMLSEKSDELSSDTKKLKELLNIKKTKSSEYAEHINQLTAKLDEDKKIHEESRIRFEELLSKLDSKNDRIKYLETEWTNLRKKLHETEKVNFMRENETEAFKSKIRTLFGINKDLEQKNIRFSDYLEKLRRLVYQKEIAWEKKYSTLEDEAGRIRKRAEDKVKEILRTETAVIISLKSSLVQTKKELKEKEEELIKRDMREREMLVNIAKYVKGWHGRTEDQLNPKISQGKDAIDESIRQKEDEVKNELAELESLKREEERQIHKELEQIPPKAPATSHIDIPVAQVVPQKTNQMPSLPNATQVTIIQSAQQAPAPTRLKGRLEPNLEHREAFNKRKHGYLPDSNKPKISIGSEKYYKKEEEEKEKKKEPIQENIHEKPLEAIYVDGQPKEETINEDAEFIKNKKVNPATDLNISYKKSDPLISMVDIGLQQGNDFNTIRESLIKTGYEKEKVEMAISYLKKQKLGGI